MTNAGFSSGSLGTVSAVFFSKKDADKAYDALLKRGHTPDDISILMSDETLEKHEESLPENKEHSLSDVVSGAIISITSMISLPGLGIAISKTLFKKIRLEEESPADVFSQVTNAQLVEQHADSYGDSMKEGGIIVSVDPKSFQEKRAIVKSFRENNGHDILGDDGYTELD
jgi:hypothetical protein